MKPNLSDVKEYLDEYDEGIAPKDVINDTRKCVKKLIEELQQLDLMKWLEENHPLGKQCFNKGAFLIDMLDKFREEILGENQQ